MRSDNVIYLIIFLSYFVLLVFNAQRASAGKTTNKNLLLSLVSVYVVYTFMLVIYGKTYVKSNKTNTFPSLMLLKVSMCRYIPVCSVSSFVFKENNHVHLLLFLES